MNGKDSEIRVMQERVKDAEEKSEKEKRKCQEKISTVEREFNEKERTLHEKVKREMNKLIND